MQVIVVSPAVGRWLYFGCPDRSLRRLHAGVRWLPRGLLFWTEPLPDPLGHCSAKGPDGPPPCTVPALPAGGSPVRKDCPAGRATEADRDSDESPPQPAPEPD